MADDTDNSDDETRRKNQEAARAERQRDLERIAREEARVKRHAEGEEKKR